VAPVDFAYWLRSTKAVLSTVMAYPGVNTTVRLASILSPLFGMLGSAICGIAATRRHRAADLPHERST